LEVFWVKIYLLMFVFVFFFLIKKIREMCYYMHTPVNCGMMGTTQLHPLCTFICLFKILEVT
jgi:hypothetical protein